MNGDRASCSTSSPATSPCRRSGIKRIIPNKRKHMSVLSTRRMPLSTLQKEIFQVMNLLDGAKTSCLKMANSSVVIATSKIFLKYAGLVNAGIAKQIYQRLKTPFLTLLSNPVPESNYCILCHIKILVERCPGLFDADFKKFFARFVTSANWLGYCLVGLCVRFYVCG